MLREVLALNVFGFLLVFARVGTALSLMPGIGAAYVTVRIRLLLALAVSFVLAPLLTPALPALPASVAELALLVLGEMAVGAFLGTLALIVVAALQVAGSVVALMSSMANAFIQDPIVEQQSATLSGFLTTLGVVLIFVTNLHYLMLDAVVGSYTLFVPGQAFAVGDMAEMVARHVADSFALGLQLAAPLVLTGIVYYLGLGLLTRLMPQMPVFFVGLPIQIAIQIAVLMLATSGMMLVFLERFQQAFAPLLAP